MKGIILAAGYATRLYPLTLNMPKALLTIGEKPIINYIIEKMEEVSALDMVYVVTNHKFAGQFEKWAEENSFRLPVSVLDDGTETEETRKGAIGDIWFTIKENCIDDELLVIAGDNFFTFDLKKYFEFYREKATDCVCVKAFEDSSALSQYGIALLDENGRVIDIEEKPEKPKSNNVVYAAYMYTRETAALFEKYLKEGNKPDAPGYFVQWLYERKPVYAYEFKEECYDIGTVKSLEEVRRIFG